ncbi:MAG: glycoside hydrolase family 127 protein [Bacteroidetes bacterium]|nr:glycoside hydrolase family 127 protein [Bacteroidota bacterium]
MKNTIATLLLAASTLPVAAQQPAPGAATHDYMIHPVNFTQVQVTDQFWLPRIETNRTVTIPASFERCRETGRMKNFTMAADRSGKFCTIFPFDDTDIYKTLEGASYSLAVHPDPALAKYLDSLIVMIGKAQEPDGYLYTARTIDPAHPHAWSGPERWVKEHELSHELYNSGHLFEAAVAHYEATGKRTLLDIALKNADLLVATFGPDKRHVAPGHEIVEMGLVKLYRITGKKEYIDLAKFFLEMRGERQYKKDSKNPWENGAYYQAHKPVTEQDEVVGHAVRAMYLYSAMTDVAALTGDTSYIRAVDRLWENMVGKKIYLHGGIGAIGDGERFGDNYELPNLTTYAETCAAIGSVYWNYRMFLLHGESKYMDILERTLYNGLISGVGLDGKSFFYTNAMQIWNHHTHQDMEPTRSGWFPCSCCPTNMARLLPSVPGYMYAVKDKNVYVNLYISGNANIALTPQQKVGITQQSNYPWDGNIHLKLNTTKPTAFALLLRIPGWARGEAIPGGLYKFGNTTTEPVKVLVNGAPVDVTIDKGYAVINRTWKKNDSIDLVLPMAVQTVMASDSVKEDIGKVALQRGPIVYCAEWVDNNNRTGNLLLPQGSAFSSTYQPGLLNGIVTLKGNGKRIDVDPVALQVSTRETGIVAIPYYAWANRGKGEMNIWFPQKLTDVDLLTR